MFNDTLLGHPLTFHHLGLFSPKGIDDGTRLLLGHLDVQPDDRAIDLGCGYGPLGLAIARSAPDGNCLMVDRGFVAVQYANANARRNRVDNAEAMLSDGLRHVPERTFTLAVTNLPAKDGKNGLPVFQRYLRTPRAWRPVLRRRHQRPAAVRARAFKGVFGNHLVKQGKQYTVALAERRPD